MKEPHDPLSVPRTVAAMLVAPFGAAAAFFAWGATRGRPPYWLAAVWGVGIAFLFSFVVMGPRVFSGPIGIVLVVTSLGAASGLTYAIAARTLIRFQRRV